MTQEERIVKAKINLLITQPWYGQLACYLNLRERKNIITAAINERGDLFFNPDFISQLNDLEVKALVCHEILHLAYLHPFRIQNRNLLLWNMAADLKVNSELESRSDLTLPKGGLIPDRNNSWELMGLKIEDIDSKTTEQIYEELYRQTPSFQISFDPQSGVMGIDVSGLPGPWQDLIKKMVKDLLNSSKKDDEIKPQELPQLTREWQERVDAVNQISKGDTPAGLSRELLALENPELPWEQIIRQRLAKLEKVRSWKKVSKRWLPYFFPGTIKRKAIKAVIAVDTSGSMSERDITKAISEIWGLALTFRHFKFYIIFNDADVWDVAEVSNGNYQKIKSLKPRGGGGTDFRPVFKMVKDKWNNLIDCLIFFTDGYGDFPEGQPFYQVYWITRSDDVKWPFGQTIHLKTPQT